MGKADVSAEPTMEELLATIRKAITDDVGLPPGGAPGIRQGEILELRNKVAGQMQRPEAPPREVLRPSRYEEDDEPAPLPRQNGFAGLLGGEPAAPPRMWQPEPPRSLPPLAYQPGYSAHDPAMLSPSASAQANAAFSHLAESLMQRALGERSIEHMTQELLRTMLKQWLDDNLPSMVERLVREEIERVARRGPLR